MYNLIIEREREIQALFYVECQLFNILNNISEEYTSRPH